MKVQRRQLDEQPEERKKALAETLSLAPTKTILYGLSSEMLTFRGDLLVRVDSDGFHGYICLKPAAVNYKMPRYYRSDVYMLRDCLIDLMGAGDFDTYSHPVVECYDIDRLEAVCIRSKNERRWLSEKLSQRLKKNDYCLLDGEELFDVIKMPRFVYLVKKVIADELRNESKRMERVFGYA